MRTLCHAIWLFRLPRTNGAPLAESRANERITNVQPQTLTKRANTASSIIMHNHDEWASLEITYAESVQPVESRDQALVYVNGAGGANQYSEPTIVAPENF